MKILNLRFKNLNSLAGEWSIDFTDPRFVTDGIFAITGPTGSGKTTILDAICLALYGATPRLDKVTAGTNEIMSRGTGECLSELTFELPSGRYRCMWSQHRARRKADGDLQNPKHELTNVDRSKLLASSARSVLEQVESITGMDFTRFTRSMLLAQGAFAAFLQSSPSERAPILEQLTGTDIYSRLSIQVHLRERQERERLQELERKIQDLSLMSPEAEVAARMELQQIEAGLVQLGSELDDLRKQDQWLTELDRLQREVARGEAEQVQLDAELTLFQPQRERLVRANVAAELDGPVASLRQLQKAFAETREKLEKLRAELPLVETENRVHEERLKQAELGRQQAEAAKTRFEPERVEMEEFDRRIKLKREEVDKFQRKRRELEAGIKSEREAKAGVLERKEELDRKLAEIKSFFTANAADEWLVTGLSGLNVQLDMLRDSVKGIATKESEAATAKELIASWRRETESLQKREARERKKADEIQQRIAACEQQSREALQGRTLEEVQRELDEMHSQKARATLVASLEEHRARLHPGEECPLCGSLEHPFIADKIPPPSELDAAIARLTGQLNQVSQGGAEVRQLWDKKCTADQAVSEAKDDLVRHSAKVEREEAGLKVTQEALAKLRAQREQLQSRLVGELRSLGIEELAGQDIEQLRVSLGKRKKQWEEKSGQRQEAENLQGTLREELAGGEARVSTLQEQQTQLVQEMEQHEIALANEVRLRKERYGERNPADEGAEIAKVLKRAGDLENDEQKLLIEKKQNLLALVTRESELRDELGRREIELQPAEEEFRKEFSARGFANESEFETARMSADLRRELAKQDEALQNRASVLEKSLAENRRRLSEEQGRSLTSEAPESLKAKLSEKTRTSNELNELKGAKGQILRENDTRKQQAAECGEEFVRQQIESRRWAKMHELIGSSDGKKFRNFAQAVTFERLIAHANQQLAKMSDRYELVPAASDPLDLSVRDHDQGGEIRTTRNLSGGESFMVSLALALGLSKMASGRVRVDSLFLDEGFGTLDEGALETALSTLADLRHTGKLIGLISHVSALNERMNTKIEIQKIGDGRSALSGPGCERINRE